ncbi:polymorphic toxin type 44 domain-containing protein [Pseudomonas maioricensis]|nr:polymorphic toxin type 44 domain-containing protein [Pseudomonas sp. S25]
MIEMRTGYYIGLGDKTDCGGEVLDAAPGITWNGVIHARAGGPVTCGKDGKTYQILGGIPHFTSDGVPIAGTLDSVSGCPCRAQLIPSVTSATYRVETNTPAQSERSSPTQSRNSVHPSAAKKPAHFADGGSCSHPDRMEELASYIADEMNRNINHPSVLEMKELNTYDPVAETIEYMALPFYRRLGQQPDFHAFALAKQARAFALWTERVGQNRPWDHKPMIKSKFDGAWQKQGDHDYFHDIWSNIHYGYIGIASGFSESVLFDGAGAEQIVSDTIRRIQDKEKYPGPSKTPGVEGLRAWDDAPDRESIQIGVNLYRRYPCGGITSTIIMKKVFEIEVARWVKGIRPHECK